MAAMLDPIWEHWRNDAGEEIVGDLGYDIEKGEKPVVVVSNPEDARLLVMVLKHIGARLP